MKRYLAMLIVFAFAASIVCAQDKAASEDKDMTVKGKIEKSEKKGEGDKVTVKYELDTTDYGKVELPKTEVKLDEFVGQDVEMAVKAVEKEKEGKKHLKVKEVVSVKKAEMAKAPDAPAAPAVVPPAPTAPVAPVAPVAPAK